MGTDVRYSFSCLLFLLVVFSYAANTVETFDEKHGYFEINMSYRGIGRAQEEQELISQAIWGKGFTDRLSGYMGMDASSDGYLSLGGFDVMMGIIATPIRQDYFNLDLFAEMGAGDSTYAGVYVDPGFELNFDLAPNQEKGGLYFDVDELLTGADTASEDTTGGLPLHQRIFTPSTNLRCAAYYTVVKGQQLHLQLDQEFHHHPFGGQKAYQFKAIRIGYNIMLTDVLQLTTEIALYGPFDDSDRGIGFQIGLGRW